MQQLYAKLSAWRYKLKQNNRQDGLMKFLHMSDLHIGKSVNGFSMLDEQRNFFAQAIGYIRSEKPKAVIIAGDIYDRAVPSVEAVKAFDDFLTELAGQEAILLLVAGNHDSPERISYANRLLLDQGLYISGSFKPTLERAVIADEHGPVSIWMLPFFKPTTLKGMYGAKEHSSYSDALRAVLNAQDIDYEGRNVLISHQFYAKAGIEPVLSDSEINPVGGIDAIDAEIVRKFDYVALGHLHGSQSVGYDHIRYAGSPVKYSFSEIKQEKSIICAELGKKGDLSVKRLPISPIHDMREIRGKLSDLISADSAYSDSNEDYIKAVLTDEEEIIDPMGKIRSAYPNAMSLSFDNYRSNSAHAISLYSEAESGRLSYFDMFMQLFLETNGSVMSEEQAAIAIECLNAEQREEMA